MFRRPARDRNYEFWGDQTFFGENPPQAAVHLLAVEEAGGEVALKITDATGREVREISGPVLAEQHQGGHPVGVLGPAGAAGAARRRPAGAADGRAVRAPGGGGRGGPGGGRGGQNQPRSVRRRLRRRAVAAAAVDSAAAAAANAGPYVLAGRLQRRAGRRRQVGRDEAAARHRRSRSRR